MQTLTRSRHRLGKLIEPSGHSPSQLSKIAREIGLAAVAGTRQQQAGGAILHGQPRPHSSVRSIKHDKDTGDQQGKPHIDHRCARAVAYLYTLGLYLQKAGKLQIKRRSVARQRR